MSPDKGKGRSPSTRRQEARSQELQRQPEVALEPSSGWAVKPASEQVHRQWLAAVAAEPDIMDAERTRLRTRPLDRTANPRRTGQLKGGLVTRRIAEQTLLQWQRELTSGRLWYCPDKATRTVWITKVDLQHPKATG